LAKDAATKIILKTAKRLRDRDGFGFDESVKYAVNKRRFLISSKMDNCFFPGNLAAKKKKLVRKREKRKTRQRKKKKIMKAKRRLVSGRRR
jgi:hypothetical protein